MRQRFTLSALLLILLLPLLGGLTAQAQSGNGIPNDCPYSDAPYYQPNLFAVYEPTSLRLILRDWATGDDVRILAESLRITTYGTPRYRWSPGCRYLHLRGNVAVDGAQVFPVWDVLSGERLTPPRLMHNNDFAWSPDAQYILGYYRHGFSRWDTFVWNLASGGVVNLVGVPVNSSYGPYFRQTYWDTARGQLLAVSAGDPNAVTAFDLTSGARLARYDNELEHMLDLPLEAGHFYVIYQRRDVGEVHDMDSGQLVATLSRQRSRYVDFTLSPDGSHLAVYTAVPGSYRYDQGVLAEMRGITVWGRATRTALSFATERAAVSQGQVAISPDNRYLVAANESVIVWELQNPAAAPLRFDGPGASVFTVRFVSPTVIETYSSAASNRTRRWDVVSGAEVPVE